MYAWMVGKVLIQHKDPEIAGGLAIAEALKTAEILPFGEYIFTVDWIYLGYLIPEVEYEVPAHYIQPIIRDGD